MTLIDTVDAPALPRLQRRSELDLAGQQLKAIAAFTAAHRMALEADAAAARSREMRVDSARAMEVLRRQHAALVARTHEQLRLSGDVLRSTCERRVILAHRNAWFVAKISSALEANGWQVVTRTDNGADAVGAAVAEQPELLLVEDALVQLPGEQVVRDVLQYSPQTLVTAQVAYSDGVGRLLDAGACEVFTRKVPPADVAARLLELAVA
jgi:CheY-like chemotaxis protein